MPGVLPLPLRKADHNPMVLTEVESLSPSLLETAEIELLPRTTTKTTTRATRSNNSNERENLSESESRKRK